MVMKFLMASQMTFLLLAFTVMVNAQPTSQSSPASERKTAGNNKLDQYAPRAESVLKLPETTRGGIDPGVNRHLSNGEQEYREGRHSAAVPELKEAIKEDPGSYDSHYLLAITLTQTGDLHGAADEFQKAVKLVARDDQKIIAYYNLGNAYFDLEQYTDAAAAYDEVLKLNPELSKVRSNLGLARAAMNQIVEAANQFKQAAQLKPEYAEAQYNLGVAYLQLGKRTEAEEQKRILTTLKPELADKLTKLLNS